MQKQVEKWTGCKPKGCAWWYLQNDPYVAEVLRIFNLAKDYPQVFNESLPNIVYEGVVFFRGAVQKCRNTWLEWDQKKEKERQQMEKTKSVGQMLRGR